MGERRSLNGRPARGLRRNSVTQIVTTCTNESRAATATTDRILFGGSRAPGRLVECDETTLHRLLLDLDALDWKDPDSAGLYYE
jgi:hypothetical protein